MEMTFEEAQAKFPCEETETPVFRNDPNVEMLIGELINMGFKSETSK